MYHADLRLSTHNARDPLPTIDPSLTALELRDHFLAAATRRLPLILDDLAANAFRRPTLVEGPLLRPSDITDASIWLIPSATFHRALLAERRTHPLIIERNLLLAEAMRSEAGERALFVHESTDIETIYDQVSQRFADLLRGLPPASDEERRALRQDANAALLAAGRASPDGSSLRTTFACQCVRPRCRQRRTLGLDEYEESLALGFLDTHNG